MGKHIKRVISIMLDCLFWCLLTALICLVLHGGYQIYTGEAIPTFWGWGYSTIISGSMEPTIPTGSLIVFHEQDNYEVGDIVIYEKDQITVMHRLTFIEGETAITQGDANNVADPPIRVSSILGKVTTHIPKVGTWLNVMNKHLVLIIVAIVSIYLIVGLVQDWEFKRKFRQASEIAKAGEQVLPPE